MQRVQQALHAAGRARARGGRGRGVGGGNPETSLVTRRGNEPAIPSHRSSPAWRTSPEARSVASHRGNAPKRVRNLLPEFPNSSEAAGPWGWGKPNPGRQESRTTGRERAAISGWHGWRCPQLSIGHRAQSIKFRVRAAAPAVHTTTIRSDPIRYDPALSKYRRWRFEAKRPSDQIRSDTIRYTW